MKPIEFDGTPTSDKLLAWYHAQIGSPAEIPMYHDDAVKVTRDILLENGLHGYQKETDTFMFDGFRTEVESAVALKGFRLYGIPVSIYLRSTEIGYELL